MTYRIWHGYRWFVQDSLSLLLQPVLSHYHMLYVWNVYQRRCSSRCSSKIKIENHLFCSRKSTIHIFEYINSFCQQIRTIGMAICVFGLNCTSFGCAKLFPVLINSEKIGLHGCMLIFSVNCVIGSFFMFFILNETRGKPMDTLHSEDTHTTTV